MSKEYESLDCLSLVNLPPVGEADLDNPSTRLLIVNTLGHRLSRGELPGMNGTSVMVVSGVKLSSLDEADQSLLESCYAEGLERLQLCANNEKSL